jgi:histidinol-phosphate aminotransferase
MQTFLSEEQKQDFLRRGFSRRSFGRIAAMITAGASLPFYNEPALAQLSAVKNLPPDVVKIDANENPLGPCPEALEAMHKVIAQGGRYLFDETSKFRETLAEQEGLSPNYVTPYAGSSAPLHQAVIAFTGPGRAFVTADPGYEAGERAAQFIGADVKRVPLTKTYAHDVKAMVAASPTAGLFYVCNPNNPTGTSTPRSDIEWLLENKPKGSILLLDEAYTHISGDPMCADLVAKDKDIIVLRTFSKIYGMAGIRAGAVFARPDLMQKITGHSAGMMPITGMVAGTASLKSKSLIPERRKLIGDVRNDLFAWLDKQKFSYMPSVSNCFMLDVKRPGREAMRAMLEQKVAIGRVWPSMPNHCRITIGTRDEMEKFKAALLKVMA